MPPPESSTPAATASFTAPSTSAITVIRVMAVRRHEEPFLHGDPRGRHDDSASIHAALRSSGPSTSVW